MKIKCRFLRLFIPLFILLLWFAISSTNIWSSYILPTPVKVFSTGIILIKNGTLVQHILVSLIRVLLGFAISFFIAFPMGIFIGLKPNVRYVLNPLFEFFRHVPPLALIPMLILWFGIGEISKAIVIILASFFPMLLNIANGFSNCDPKLIEVGMSFGFSKSKIFYKIILPNAINDIIIGMRIGLGYSWRAIIGAELIAASSGIGYLILDSQSLSRPDKVIVGILAIGILGIAIDSLFRILTKKLEKGKC
ncbi:ABC transporter permease [Clostridiaceae bacterium M8S5]|nr:ABC transporter permease [Clostridiaceae bacterium M8S5]